MKTKHLLAIWRKNHGLTRQGLSDMIKDRSGHSISKESIYNWEMGRFQPLYGKAEIVESVTDGEVPASYLVAYMANRKSM